MREGRSGCVEPGRNLYAIDIDLLRFMHSPVRQNAGP